MSVFRIATLSVLICSLLVHDAVAEDKRQDEHESRDTAIERFQGRWEIIGGKNQGRKLLPTEVAGTYVTVVTNSIVTYDHSQQEKFRAVFRINESKSPTRITLTSVPKAAPVKIETSPAAKQQTTNPVARGIIKFVGSDECVLCYGLPGAKRPKKFESPHNSDIMLFRLRKTPVDTELLQDLREE